MIKLESRILGSNRPYFPTFSRGEACPESQIEFAGSAYGNIYTGFILNRIIDISSQDYHMVMGLDDHRTDQ